MSSNAFLIQIGKFGLEVGAQLHAKLFEEHNIDMTTGIPKGETVGDVNHLFEQFEEGRDGIVRYRPRSVLIDEGMKTFDKIGKLG